MEHIRQLDIFNPEDFKDLEVTIVGCGSIGSFTCLSLAKMGMKNFVCWDFDKIEKHNLPNQFFMENQLNQKKNIALKSLVKSFVKDVKIKTKNKLEKDSIILSDIVILCTDDMKSRKLGYNQCKNISRFLIDARMGGEVMVIYTIDLKNKNQRKQYEKTLYSDEESESLKCTEKSIIYNILGIGGIICNQLKKILNKEDYFFEISFDYKNLVLLKRRFENGKSII